MTWYFKTKIIFWNGPQQPSQRLWSSHSRLVWWLRDESIIWKPAPFVPDFCPINKTNPWTRWQWVQCTHFNVSVTVVTKLDNLRIFVDIMLYPNIFNVKTNWIKAINKCTSYFLWIRDQVWIWVPRVCLQVYLVPFFRIEIIFAWLNINFDPFGLVNCLKLFSLNPSGTSQYDLF